MNKVRESNQTNEEKQSLSSVRERFVDYRINREKFGPLPEELWESAVQLCNSYPKSTVSKELGLNHSALLSRLREESSDEITGRPSGAGKVEFIDLFRADSQADSRSESECILEIRERDGMSLKMHCRGESGIDVVSLCQIFMENR